MGHVPDWVRKPITKKPSPMKASNCRDTGNPFHGPNASRNADSNRPVQRFAEGGEVSLWERLKAGNIDEPGSEAYNRWGKGAVDESDAEKSRLSRQVKIETEPDWESNMGQGRQPTRSEYEPEKKTASDYDEIRKEKYRSEPAPKKKAKAKKDDAGPMTRALGAFRNEAYRSEPPDEYPDEASRGTKPRKRSFWDKAEDYVRKRKAAAAQ